MIKIPATESCTVCVARRCNWSPAAVRDVYQATIAAWEEAGVPPDMLFARVPGVSARWGSFRQKRRHLERGGFEGLQALSISHRVEGAADAEQATAKLWLSSRRHDLVLSWVPSLIGEGDGGFDALFQHIAGLAGAGYGFRYRAHWLTPGKGAADLIFHRHSPANAEQESPPLLWNVFPRNYLSEPFLEAPVGFSGKTLRKWIEVAPHERGELRPFTDRLVEWTPPLEQIPQLREALYRGGRIFDPRFPHATMRQEPNLLYRPDLSVPWEATGSIPEMFRADCRSDNDEVFLR